MKQVIIPAAFNPAGRTIDFSNVAGFNPTRLLAIINSSSRAVILDPTSNGLGIASLSGSVVTLQADVSTQLAGDRLIAFYDDGQSPATAAKQDALLAAVGSPLQEGGAVSDAQSAPFSGAVAMTPGATYAAQRSVGVLCTVAGNVEFRFSDGSTIILPVNIGWEWEPYKFACTGIVAAGTTATATCYNLK